MAAVPDPTYITADEVAEQTRVTGLADLEEDDLTYLIQTAEDQIDAYVGPQQHHQWDGNLDRVFPRTQDFSVVVADGVRTQYPETPVIPYRVSRACLRQVEWLFTQWWPSAGTASLPTDHDLSSREIGGDGSYGETRARGGTDLAQASLCHEAKALLTSYVSRSGGIATTDVRTSPLPLSDDAVR